MRKRNFKPYGIDTEYEYKTYKYVGRNYEDSKDASAGCRLRLKKYLRKRRRKKQKRYAFCNTYTEWESHVKALVRTDIANSNDLLHWLYAKRNTEEQVLEAVKTILIPVYLVLLSALNLFGEISKGNVVWVFTTSAVIIILVASLYLYDAINRVNFYNDFIKIIEMVLETNKCEQK